MYFYQENTIDYEVFFEDKESNPLDKEIDGFVLDNYIDMDTK